MYFLNYFNNIFINLDDLISPSDIIYSSSRNLICFANLGNNTIMLIDAKTYKSKYLIGIP